MHQHGVVRDAPTLSAEWIEQILNVRSSTYIVHEEGVWDGGEVAEYLTTSLDVVNGRQRYFHETSIVARMAAQASAAAPSDGSGVKCPASAA